jgi:hypothetical protein
MINRTVICYSVLPTIYQILEVVGISPAYNNDKWSRNKGWSNVISPSNRKYAIIICDIALKVDDVSS